MNSISKMQMVDSAHASKLAAAGVSTAEALLKRGATAEGRRHLASDTSIDEAHILRYVNFADLCRVKGVSVAYSNLLEAAGVDTVAELGQRNAANLHAALAEANAQHGVVKQLPSLSKVEAWVQHAKQLGRGVHY